MKTLQEIFSEAHIEIDADKLVLFETYTDLLLEWNKKMNLTAITDREEIAVKHFIDSLTLLEFLGDYGFNRSDSEQNLNSSAFSGNCEIKLIDIGSGAGFPGVPLKIMRPHIKLTLLDSLSKRVMFLQELTEQLGFDHTECIHARAEEIPNGFEETFDVAVSRAVAGLDTLSAYALGYLKTGGVFIAMKGAEPTAETNAAAECIKNMGGEINSVKEFTLGASGIKRSVIIIDKINHTPAGYPKKLVKQLKAAKKSRENA